VATIFINFPENELTKFRAVVFHPAGSELDMDIIHPWIKLIGFGWIR